MHWGVCQRVETDRGRGREQSTALRNFVGVSCADEVLCDILQVILGSVAACFVLFMTSLEGDKSLYVSSLSIFVELEL